MPNTTPDKPTPHRSVQNPDTLSRTLLESVIHTLNHAPLYDSGCTTDYEMLEAIAKIVDQRRKPAEGTTDINTGLRY